MIRRSFGDNHELAEVDLGGEIPTVISAVLMMVAVFWMVTFIDTTVGDRTLQPDEMIIKKNAKLQVVKPTEKVVPKHWIEKLKKQIETEKRRTKDALDHGQALGVMPFSGSPSGVVVLVDLTMTTEQRASVKQLIRHMQANKIVLIACGDEVEAMGQKLVFANKNRREEACRQLDIWPRSKERRLLDAIEGAFSIDGSSRIVLCLAGMPSGGGLETVEYVKRRRYPVPMNCIDFTLDNRVRVFLTKLVVITKGSYQKGR